jgi:hypothetical protein
MRARAFKPVGRLGAIIVLTGAFSSCLDGADIAFGDCPTPDFAHLNRYGDLDPCCIDTTVTPCGPSGPSECDGECQPKNANPFWSPEPVLFRIGDDDQVPPTCPDSTESPFIAHADPISIGQCSECACSDPACALPASVIASDAVGCNGPTFTDFPVASDGSCSTGVDVKPNMLKSLGILSPTVSTCTPGQVPVTVPRDIRVPSQWGTVSVACAGTGFGKCDATGDVCVPSTAPPSGFMQCLQSTTIGVTAELTPCPDEGKKSGYIHKYVVYMEIDENVACTECKCGAPVGSDCTAAVSAYQDKSCATPIFESYVVSSGNPQCVTVGPTLPLQGVKAQWLTDQAGTCTPSGGEPTGKVAVKHETAIAYCCRE